MFNPKQAMHVCMHIPTPSQAVGRGGAGAGGGEEGCEMLPSGHHLRSQSSCGDLHDAKPVEGRTGLLVGYPAYTGNMNWTQ